MPVLVICGATATGKTALAVECAKKLNTEIISADSMLVYWGSRFRDLWCCNILHTVLYQSQG